MLNKNYKKIVNYVKNLGDSIGLEEDDLYLYTGVFLDNGDEIKFKIIPEEDNFITFQTDESFGVYLENNYSFIKARNLVFNKISNKRHKGLFGFDEENWSLTAYCKLEEYPYSMWPMIEIIQDICNSAI